MNQSNEAEVAMAIPALSELGPCLQSTSITGGSQTLNVNRNIPLCKSETERMDRGREFNHTSLYQHNPH